MDGLEIEASPECFPYRIEPKISSDRDEDWPDPNGAGGKKTPHHKTRIRMK